MMRWTSFVVLILIALVSCDKNPGSSRLGYIDGLTIDKESANPVAGVIITLDNLKDTTGSDGKYLFPGVHTGTHILNARGNGYLNYTDTVKVSYGYNYFKIALTHIPASPYGILSGAVLDSSTSNPVSGAVVQIEDRKDTTTQSGNYKIDSLAAGSHVVTVTAKGYSSYARDVIINEGDNNLDVSLRVLNDNVGSVSGLVYESGTGVPVTSAIVEIDNKKDTTGSDGKFSFSEISTGSYVMVISAANYDKLNQPVTIVKGVNNFNIMMVALGSLSGTVTSASTNKKLPGVTIQLNEKTSTTDQNGIYSIENVPAGTYNLTAKLDKYNDFSKSITIKKGENSLDIQLTPKQLYTNVYGTVTNGLGSPVQGALIKLAGNQQVTPATGFYQFPSVPQGTYDITVTKDGYKDYNKSIILSSSDYRYDVQMIMQLIAPPIITGIMKTGPTDITLNLDPVTDPNLSGYAVYNITDTTTAVNSFPANSGTTSYKITNTSPGIYSYRIASVNLENKSGTKSSPSDTAFVYQKINGEDFESSKLNPAVWTNNNFDYTVISDSKYVIDGNYSLMYMGGTDNIFSSTTILPSLNKYVSVAKVMCLMPGSRFSMALTNGQSGGSGTNPIVWLEVDSNGNVSIGYKVDAGANMYPYKPYGSYVDHAFKLGLFVDTMIKKFSIVVDDVVIYTASYTNNNLDTLSMYFENRQIIDDIEIGALE